jgi:antitoxin component HigA of HigAB toxin-antitoxin module
MEGKTMKTSTARDGRPRYRKTAGIPSTYHALCTKLWLPRPIHDRKTAAEATAVADALAGFPLNEEQEDYLEAVALFLEEHEGTQAPRVSGRQLLRRLCEENGLSGAALSRILGASRLLGSMLLRGDRNITAEHARALGKHFKLDPGAFL